MELKLYDPKQNDGVVRLALRYGNGGIEVVAVDVDGDEIDGGILCLITSGGIRRYQEVSERFGFTLNGDGQLRWFG